MDIDFPSIEGNTKAVIDARNAANTIDLTGGKSFKS